LTLLQVKFSELTIDMFRMLQALEREPMNLASQMNKPGMQVSSISMTDLGTVLNWSGLVGWFYFKWCALAALPLCRAG